MSADDDMTPEEFDEAWENGEPVEIVIPEGGLWRTGPTTYGSGRSYNFTWTPETGLQERP